MSINLSAQFSHPSAVTNRIAYARIDNTTTPTYIQAGDFTTSPAIIATNIDAGQYSISITPIYADGRVCEPTFVQTPACPGLSAISAYVNSGALVVSYTAPPSAPKVRITVFLPNGGTIVNNYVNSGTDVVIPLPTGLTGQFTAQGQSVCDESSGFYSGPSSPVVVSIGAPVAGTFTAGVSAGTVCNGTPTTLYTNGPFAIGQTLFTDLALENVATGYNFVVYNNAVYAIDPGTGIVGNPTGASCGATITGSTGMSASMPTNNGNIIAPAGTIVNVSLSAGGPVGGTYTVQFYIPSMSIAQSVTNGVTTFQFTMPAAGTVSWNANYTSSNTDGGAGVNVS